MVDYHTHIGQFYDFYTSPSELIRTMDSVGVERFACSSTTICEGNYDKVLSEMSELVHISENRVFPVLWILPQMLSDDGLLRFINSGIPWRMLKIHPQLHPLSWQCGSRNLQKVVRLAKHLNLPLLIHTGESPGCYPSLFERAIRHNPAVTFILAHGRPLDETISLMQKYPNVLTDTAFMPVEHIAKFCHFGLAHRVLWGTDVPIQRYYNRKEDIMTYYKKRLCGLRDVVSNEHYEIIMSNIIYNVQIVKNSNIMDNTFICAMLAMHTLAAKEAFGANAVVALNAGELGVYENNPTIIEYEQKGYKFCDANMFGEGLERMETLTFQKVNKS